MHNTEKDSECPFHVYFPISELRVTQIIFIKYSELYPDSKRSVVFIKKICI